MDPLEPELIELSWVAQVAYEDLVSGQAAPLPDREQELLELLARGISLEATVYGVLEGSGLQMLARDERFAGRFAEGGERFEFDDGRPALAALRVRMDELPPPVQRALRARRNRKIPSR